MPLDLPRILELAGLNGTILDEDAKTSSTKIFDSLDAIVAWARSIGVKLEAKEHLSAEGERYAGRISIVWIARSKKAPPGTGAHVMDALCRYADHARAIIDLQADDEVGLPAYYARFGFKIDPVEGDHDVRPTGPDMIRFPKTRKAKGLLGSARPFDADQPTKPIGVAVMLYGDHPSSYMLFPPNKARSVQRDLPFYDADDVWVGYIIDTIEWTELLPKVNTGTIERIPSTHPNPPDEKWVRSNKRWADLPKLGKIVFRITP